MPKKLSRKEFLIISGAGTAGLTATGCDRTVNKAVTYLNQPVYPKPGEWAHYAVTCRECPAGCGMHIKFRDGRVTKAEGNPDHEINRGSLCARGQSSLQGQYDPDRLKDILHRRNGESEKSTWAEAVDEISGFLKSKNGRIFIISDLQKGALAEVMLELTSEFNSPPPIFYEALNYESLKKSQEVLFGKPFIPRYDLAKADLIISFGVDFLETWISPVEFMKQFTQMHKLQDGEMGRFIYAGPRLSMTAGNADEFIKISPDSMRNFAVSLYNELGYNENRFNNISPDDLSFDIDHIKKIAGSIRNASNPVILAGPAGATGSDAEDICLIASLINYRTHTEAVDFSVHHALSLTSGNEQVKTFFDSLSGNDLLLIHNTNPVFTGGFAEQIRKAGLIVYLGTLPDETSEISDWVLPVYYSIEDWGDYEPYTGFHSLMQPAMMPLYDTRSAGDILLVIASEAGSPLKRNHFPPDGDYYEWVISRWKELAEGEKSTTFPKNVLRTGFFKSKIPVEIPEPGIINRNFSFRENRSELNLWCFPSLFLYDGRTANRGWLQEVPDPIRASVWGNWAEVNQKTAEKYELGYNGTVNIENRYGNVLLPVIITEDIADNTVAVQLGNGHTASGISVSGIGSNTFVLLSNSEEVAFFPPVNISPAEINREAVFLTATEFQYNRNILKWIAKDEISLSNREEIIPPLKEGWNPERDLYKPHEHKEYRWGMTIDLHACTGCGACSVACYAENNIPVVGKEQCINGREMTWLKVVPYRKEDEPGRTGWLPLPCQHCDSAPCESVCPTYASMHNEEGLNAQIYNRCIGTRYCSNNCPYKVRRFNWFVPQFREPLNMQLNPEVTVRTRGVMEKCTFCVQRIRNAEYSAKRNNTKVKDGEIIPACAQTCPAEAITFGNLLDNTSRTASIMNSDNRRYQLLKELNTKTAVIYLKRITNE